MKSVYRVNYYDHGQPASIFICAESDVEASQFVGVRDGSAQVSRVAGPVEVVGMDAAHPEIPPVPVFKAPPLPPNPVPWEKFDALTQELANLRLQIAKQGPSIVKP